MPNLGRAVNIEDLRRMARRRLPRSVFDFFDGGAEDETTLRGNRAAFERVRLLPRVLVDVHAVDSSVDLLGMRSNLPMAIAPTGAIGAGRHDADLMLARAARAAGIPYTLATPATNSIEEIAEQAGGRLWFQLYLLKNRAFRMKLVRRAAAAGYEALLVTVDLTTGGKRERDLRNDFAAPFVPTWRNSRDVLFKPSWLMGMARRGVPHMKNLEGMLQKPPRLTDVAASVGRELDASFDWDELRSLRDAWPGKLLLKGIVRPDDAERAAAAGCDGVVVSNHGGRQLDGAIATADALPAVARAVGSRIAVLVDGGVRRGVDLLKARALGAQGVLTGRATLFGVMAGGEAGARRAIEILAGEFERALMLCGVPRASDIPADLVAA
ncbi:MAG: alpha-hydroxy-acid oxidizing protein [Betaproteobacteria bacterium]|nr:alpha-hydroxy-acid oxidizing protein [Betaproteobacteria bacterium]MDH5221597.1 alpha-hydroxy-acid oxidizing protein [Betaproteobacteria bacterium]MDH5349846.1 alpha-hydroxy-acid oxidizing protein [Betaproteobacteria bacterium]